MRTRLTLLAALTLCAGLPGLSKADVDNQPRCGSEKSTRLLRPMSDKELKKIHVPIRVASAICDRVSQKQIGYTDPDPIKLG